MSSSPVSKNEKEKQKLIQEKCQTILAAMLRDEDNKYCVDCDAKGPRWASWNLGIFLCIRCAGIHRNLGVHISRVKSVNLDSWTPEQVVTLQQMGNSRARAVYEANLPDSFRRPQADSALESFIRAKYESKKYIAREWVQPPPVKVSWDAEIELEMKRKKEAKRKTNGSPASAVELPSTSSTRSRGSDASSSTTNSSTTTPKEPSQPEVSLPPPCKPSSAAQDLLGLDTLVSHLPTTDMFGGLLSGTEPTANGKPATASAPVTAAKDVEEDNFFNQKAPSAAEKRTLDKNSILALYNQGSTTTAPAMQTNLFASQNAFGAVPQSTFGQTSMMGSALHPMNPNMNQMGMMQGTMSGTMAGVMPGVMPGSMPGQMAGSMPTAMSGGMPSAMPGAMQGPMPGAMPAFNPLVQGNMYSSPMYSTAAQGPGVNQLAQQLNGLSFGSPVNPMMATAATATPIVPGMMMNQAPTGMGMNPGVMPGSTNNAFMFMSASAPTTAQQQPTTLSTNLWQ